MLMLAMLLQAAPAVEAFGSANFLLSAGMALVSVTAIVITTRSAVGSLEKQSQIIIDALKDQLKTLNVSVDKLGDTVQKLTVEVALRDERVGSLDRRMTEIEEDVKNVRQNFHQLRNWLMAASLDPVSVKKMPQYLENT